MPSVSEKQRRFMVLCATKPEKAHNKCPPKSVAQEFMHADKKKKKKDDPYD